MRGTPAGEIREKFLLRLALSRTASLRARREFVREVWGEIKTSEFESSGNEKIRFSCLIGRW